MLRTPHPRRRRFFRPAGGARAASLGSLAGRKVETLSLPPGAAGITHAWVGSDATGDRVASLKLLVDGERVPWSCGAAKPARMAYFTGPVTGGAGGRGYAAGGGAGGRAVQVLCGINGVIGRDHMGKISVQALTSFGFARESGAGRGGVVAAGAGGPSDGRRRADAVTHHAAPRAPSHSQGARPGRPRRNVGPRAGALTAAAPAGAPEAGRAAAAAATAPSAPAPAAAPAAPADAAGAPAAAARALAAAPAARVVSGPCRVALFARDARALIQWQGPRHHPPRSLRETCAADLATPNPLSLPGRPRRRRRPRRCRRRRPCPAARPPRPPAARRRSSCGSRSKRCGASRTPPRTRRRSCRRPP
jgi:hypothetical protein